ncbi:hypothetical protein FOZ60_009482 [Perkinsus olseni]|uniref:Uncharacterized protein n=1 Tax=Perkinsus olseni TaxID=32597 RepID=A0A7J6NH63_PEROL|nr:hypothetical protein FOZ60_009482 [Perkinsus olseni]
MTRQTALSRFLTLAALSTPLSHPAAVRLRSLTPDAPTRTTIVLTDEKATMSKTVVGIIDEPGKEKTRLVDVTHVEYPKGHNGYVRFSVVADEDVLKDYTYLPNNKSVEKIPQSTPPSLKAQLMHSFGWGLLLKYAQHFMGGAANRDLYATRVQDVELAHSVIPSNRLLIIRYQIYLRRPSVDQSFKLTALKAELVTNIEEEWWVVTPKFNADKLRELLSHSEQVTPESADSSAESTTEIAARQLEAYSNYISPLAITLRLIPGR